MKKDYIPSRNHNRWLKLTRSYLLVFITLFAFSATAFSQTLTDNGPLCAGTNLVLNYDTQGCGATSVVFSGAAGTQNITTNTGGVFTAVFNNVLASQGGTYTATPNNGPTCPVLTTPVVVYKPVKIGESISEISNITNPFSEFVK